ncbi:hypothetical protein DID88_008991 [Monilinia fructigena]|uniref:Uncharacterized protein n=1 Tax=Monilinia fructigena TaxID=38457 RepID=A0A395IIA5_9HELO|nr:hypothetical protein DID88_008991 [Monilinia fructigena]
MSTAPDPKFPDLPGLIFGCSPTKHRRSPVKMLLGRYNVKVRGNDRKEDYLLKLVELENSIGEREKEALANWFAGENTCKALAALLGDAFTVQIKASDQISCPQCSEMVSDIDIKAYASPEVLESKKRHPRHGSRKNAKLCPNPECGMRIQKKSGCDHLTCDYCLFEFCWACCVDLNVIKKRGNGAHKPECEWHTDNKNGMPGHGRRRAAALRQPVTKAPKESKGSKKLSGERCEVGGASKDLSVREDMKGPEKVTGSEHVKKAYEANETVKSGGEPLVAIGLTQPDIPTESEESFQTNELHEAAKSLGTIRAMESTQFNPLKRRLED